jgi:hypothetical protein
MANIVTIEFVPCPSQYNATYRVRYRRNSSEGYTQYPGTFQSSPIMFSVAGDPVTQQYEGFLDVYCNGVAGPQIPFIAK